jgi:hypothetical protein
VIPRRGRGVKPVTEGQGLRDPFEDLPGWVASVAWRLDFFARGRPGARRRRRALRRVLAPLRARLAAQGGSDAVLMAFCEACLVLAETGVEGRPDLAWFRPVIARLSAIARAELAAEKDDRPLLEAERALEGLPDPVPYGVAQVPGRTVFLAAMAAWMPSEEQAAAVMLANDLATLGIDLPRVALEVAAGLRRLRSA